MFKVSVIIINWNRPDDTLACLKSLDECNLKDIEGTLILVDNGSTDNSVERFEQNCLKNWNCVLLRTGKNLGFAAGNNFGIKYALDNKAQYIVLLNNDTIVDKNLFVNLLKTYRTTRDVGILSPKIYFAPGFEYHKERYTEKDKGKVIWYAGGEIDWNNVYGKTRGVDEVDTGQYDKLTETDFANGACLMISGELMKKFKGFDEKYFMYYEDTDLSHRVKLAGLKVIYDPSSVVWHKVSQSSGIGSDLNDYFISRNRLLFGMKYASLRTKFALLRESVRLLFSGRVWQRIGIRDFYLHRFGKGSWK